MKRNLDSQGPQAARQGVQNGDCRNEQAVPGPDGPPTAPAATVSAILPAVVLAAHAAVLPGQSLNLDALLVTDGCTSLSALPPREMGVSHEALNQTAGGACPGENCHIQTSTAAMSGSKVPSFVAIAASPPSISTAYLRWFHLPVLPKANHTTRRPAAAVGNPCRWGPCA